MDLPTLFFYRPELDQFFYFKSLSIVLAMLTLLTAPEAAASTRGNTASLILQGGEKLQTSNCSLSDYLQPSTAWYHLSLNTAQNTRGCRFIPPYHHSLTEIGKVIQGTKIMDSMGGKDGMRL